MRGPPDPLPGPQILLIQRMAKDFERRLFYGQPPEPEQLGPPEPPRYYSHGGHVYGWEFGRKPELLAVAASSGHAEKIVHALLTEFDPW